MGGLKVSTTWEAFSGRLGVGVDNRDGSCGLNAGGSVSLVGAELTAEYSGNSLTLGGSLGQAAAGSIGLRDADGDGRPELCIRLEGGPGIFGACIESPF